MRKTRIEKLTDKFPFATKEFLHKQYVVLEKSLPELYNEYKLDYKATQDLCKHYGITLRSISQSRLTKTGKEKIKQSYISKLGVENPSQLESVKEKKKKTFLKHYGVDNIWKSKEYYEWLTDYMLINYGVKRISTNPWGWKGQDEKQKEERIKRLWKGRDKWWASLSDEEKSTLMGKMCSANTISSKLETTIGNALDRLHITYKRWASIGNRNFDFKIDKSKILIEVNGDFWHANPTLYTGNQELNFPGGKVKAKSLWENDNNKRLTAEQNGYKVITIWESELIKMSDREIEEWLLKNIL